ncbi:MAG: DUF5069 domain-containing protein [Candidatus Methylacidiphilales bacterium]|nr:DUF5069 domain-containing protein [Candidatus Methylacidiphilales bacterium]
MKIEGLRSPYELVGGIVYFGRLVDKVRLAAAGKLPPEYAENLGIGFDGRCATFLNISYDALKEHVLHAAEGDEASDEAIFTWATEHGRKPTDFDVELWNSFMTKRCWRDAGLPVLRRRLKELGAPLDGSILTMFDYIDLDEGHPPRKFPAITDDVI